ncbi:MAG: SCP2 sterol-binding domain-containing protein [Alphaproteobacteria bacterium]|nr:SCP2 sterol-binding domain-containing protein [Alphaproteobacteria bacterium]
MSDFAGLTEKFRDAVGADSGLGKSVKFNLKGDGFIHIDGGAVTNEDAPADLTLTIATADLQAMGKGELDAMAAVMSGKLQLSDMSAAMALQPKLAALMQKMK